MTSRLALDPEAEMQWIDSASLKSVQFHPITDTIESIHNIVIRFIPVRLLLWRFCTKFKISDDKNQSQMHTIQLIAQQVASQEIERMIYYPSSLPSTEEPQVVPNQLNGVHLTLILVT